MPDPLLLEPRVRKDAADVAFDSTIFDPLRDAVAAMHAAGDRSVTLKGEVQAAVVQHVKHLSRTRNRGQPFPARKGDLPRGRPRTVKKEAPR